MYEQYTHKDIFIIKARCLTAGVDFYKEITTDTDFITVMESIFNKPEVIVRLNKLIKDTEDTRYQELLKVIREKEEGEYYKEFDSFVKTKETLPVEELNKELIDAIINIRYNNNEIFSLDLEDLLRRYSISLAEMNDLIKDTGSSTSGIKIKILYDIDRSYAFYHSADSGYRWLSETVKEFLGFVKKINATGYIVGFTSERLFGKNEIVYAYDLLDKIVKSPSWPSSKYLLHKCNSILRGQNEDRITTSLKINLD